MSVRVVGAGGDEIVVTLPSERGAVDVHLLRMRREPDVMAGEAVAADGSKSAAYATRDAR